MTNWNVINGLGGKFSAQDIRKNILSYIIRNYPASQVEFIEKEYNNYKVDIRGGANLIFDLKGQFVKAFN
ncbi:PepSY-like domain-containing protein [Sphingobacterium anhuiense]|uniref:PepSY-like domain-containing protein n=1 Tax=Sphingobacterium anhuiense TaxID=493780 RepID=A0ABW5YQK3_9SPHI